MSSLSLPVHPPYAMPFASATHGEVSHTLDPFAAAALPRVPYVPPNARLAAATAPIDAPDEAALVPGARLDTPLHAPVVSREPETLPSIDQFLLEPSDDGGAATMAALFSAHEVAPEPVFEARDIDGAPATTTAADEPWAIADATEAVAELADGLMERGSAGAPSGAESDATSELEPLEPWADDERWMDIMPALQTPGGPDLASETAWARAFAEPPAPLMPAPLPAGDTEAAAASLEAVARRLRAGDLDIPGFRGDRGDAAALAAALAALLGAGS